MPQRRLIPLLLPFLLTGCAVSKTQVERSVPTNDGVPNETLELRPSMPLASPLGPARRIVQKLTALWPGRKETLLCVLELDNRRIAMAGLTNEGLSLFNLTYDGHVLNSDRNPLLPDSVAPEFIIADLQLAFWPLASLQKILSKPWRLETDISRRRLYYNDERRVDVHYLSRDAIWPESVEVVNYLYNYRLRIQTIEYETVSE